MSTLSITPQNSVVGRKVSNTSAPSIVVVGAGAAGLAAAVEAREAGAPCVVLEAFPSPGGAGATAGGGVCIVGTPLQQAAGVEDSVELALRDWLAIGGPDVDVDWARYYLKHSLEDVYRWAETTGVRFKRLEHYEGNSVPRIHFPEGGGAEIIERLFARALQLGAAFRPSTVAVELIRNDSGITGVVVSGPDGGSQIEAGAVVVATGGFCNDHERLLRLLGPWSEGERLLCGGALQARGLGHDLLARVGARFAFLDHVFIYAPGTPDPDDPAGLRGLTVRTPPGGVVVNPAGHRIYDETLVGFVSSGRALMAQQPRTSRLVFDADGAATLQIGEPGYRRGNVPIREKIDEFLNRSAHVHRSPTLDGLASAAGVDRIGLKATIASFNRWVADGIERDPAFGRKLGSAQQLARPPFYAIEFYPLARKSLGGVVTDMSCRVLDGNGHVIPGLFAAGEVAGMAGGHINGSAGLEGTMIAPSILAGRIAGRTAAAETLQPANSR